MFCIPIDISPPETPSTALISLMDKPYGFSFIDLGITAEDTKDFDEIKIDISQDFNYFGKLIDIEEKIFTFLQKIGSTDSAILERVAHRINAIAKQVLTASQEDFAWVFLRASTPTDRYDNLRWHMDGYYFFPERHITQYKFVFTFVGAHTLFYPIPKEYVELRHLIWIHMNNRNFLNEICQDHYVITPKKDQGVLFIVGDSDHAAVHSEPPIHENRLFFSIVPCKQDQIKTLKDQVARAYPSS